MEPIKPGAYQTAIEKRGPGLHHLAIDVLDIENYIESISGSGWLLHPKSIKSLKLVQTAYLARPGFPGLIEVQQKKELQELPLFVEGVHANYSESLGNLLKHVGLESIVKMSSTPELTLSGKRIKLENLF